MSRETKNDPRAEEEQNDAVIGKAFRWSLIVMLLLAIVIGGTIWILNRPEQAPKLQQSEHKKAKVRDTAKIEPPTLQWTNVTREAGITFTHINGATGEKLLPETMGGGVAFFDYDNDGDQDLLLVNSCHWPWSPRVEGNDDAAARPTMALYRNDSTREQIRFTDVTIGSGLDACFYGMGVAVGDYDNDGRVDVFISAVGPNRTFRNLGDGTFAEVTSEAGVAGDDDQWSTSSAYFDYDNDGDLDLFVCNYVKWSRAIDAAQNFQIVGVGRAYGPPLAFEGSHPYLYRNDGNGKFTDVSASAGVHVANAATGVASGKSLGVAPVDVDGDGYLDLIIANDTVQNFLFHNIAGDNSDRKFEEIGAHSGIAFDPMGKARGAMGIDTARFRNDGSLGVVIGNFANEMSALYVSRRSTGTPLFTDDTSATGLGPPGRLDLKFGTFFFDADLDGRLDVLHANGHLEEEINKVQSSQHYRQSARLMWNAGPKSLIEFLAMSREKTGDALLTPIVGRGSAYADIDGDGDLDVILTQIGGPPLLLRNDQQLGHHHHVRIKLVGDPAKGCNRDAIGAWVHVTADGVTQSRQVMPTRSYLSQVELPVTFGLGEATKVEKVEIMWPGKATTKVDGVDPDKMITIRQ